MKNVSTIILLLITGQFSQGQGLTAKDFYHHLGKAITAISSDSIILTTVEYGCLGSQITWRAQIKPIGDMIKVDFYSQRSKDITKPSAELVMVLDTTFTVEKSIIRKKLREEITEVKSRPIFIEASFEISILQGTSAKEFLFRRGEGLYYLLRFNKSWTTYFTKI